MAGGASRVAQEEDHKLPYLFGVHFSIKDYVILFTIGDVSKLGQYVGLLC